MPELHFNKESSNTLLLMCTFSVTINNIQAGKSRLQLVQGSKECKTYEDMQMNQNSRGRTLFEEMGTKSQRMKVRQTLPNNI